MRFALITDVHFGPRAHFQGKLRKLSHEAGRLTRSFADHMRSAVRPDLVIQLGDAIEDQSPAADRQHYAEFLAALAGFDAPVLHVAGNHDTVHLSERELGELWGHDGPLYYSRRCGDVEFIVLHTQETKDVAVRLPEAQLAWLARTLEAARPPVVVVMHHPASEMHLAGNRWFEKAPHICRVAERKALRRVLEASNKVVAVFNGHAHWNHFDLIAGIPYVTLQSLTENVDDDAPGRAAAAFAVCDLDARRLRVDVGGEQPVRYQVELTGSYDVLGRRARTRQ